MQQTNSVYKFANWIRWGLFFALVAALGLSFYASAYFHMVFPPASAKQAERPRCLVKISRDFNHTAPIGNPALESLLSTAGRCPTFRQAPNKSPGNSCLILDI